MLSFPSYKLHNILKRHHFTVLEWKNFVFLSMSHNHWSQDFVFQNNFSSLKKSLSRPFNVMTIWRSHFILLPTNMGWQNTSQTTWETKLLGYNHFRESVVSTMSNHSWKTPPSRLFFQVYGYAMKLRSTKPRNFLAASLWATPPTFSVESLGGGVYPW